MPLAWGPALQLQHSGAKFLVDQIGRINVTKILEAGPERNGPSFWHAKKGLQRQYRASWGQRTPGYWTPQPKQTLPMRIQCRILIDLLPSPNTPPLPMPMPNTVHVSLPTVLGSGTWIQPTG